jgi:hypothetical protein
MKNAILFFVTIVTFSFMASSCYYDSEEALYPSLSSTCDTTNITFSGKIAPILSGSCLSCHSNAMAGIAGNGIKLEDYADVKARVAAISGSINQTGGYSSMPKNGGKLNACSIKLFDLWVSKGALNN